MSERKRRRRRLEVGPPLLSAHGAILVQIAADQDVTVETVASRLDVTTRTVRRVISELEDAEILRRIRVGNRNAYELRREAAVDVPLKTSTLGEFLNRMN